MSLTYYLKRIVTYILLYLILWYPVALATTCLFFIPVYLYGVVSGVIYSGGGGALPFLALILGVICAIPANATLTYILTKKIASRYFVPKETQVRKDK